MAFCAELAGDHHPPSAHPPSALQAGQGDRGLPSVECGYSGRDPFLAYSTDESNTEYYLTVVAGYTNVDMASGHLDGELGASVADACTGRRQGCVTDGRVVVAVGEKAAVLFADGVQVLADSQNAGTPSLAELQTRVLHAADALGLQVPSSMRDFTSIGS